MQFIKTRSLMITALLAFIVLTGSQVFTQADEPRQPDLPAACANIQAEEGNRVAFHVYAIGVQVYRWNGTSWGFVGPVASLYSDDDYHGKVGTHYATPNGPAWESTSGSRVIATKVRECVPDSNAIAWLWLRKVSTEGPGIFDRVTFIHRVNTTGGVAPTEPGTTVGQEKRVPYTTEYYFYRATN